jgi:hypothetical protein
MILVTKTWGEISFPTYTPDGDDAEPNFEDDGFDFVDEPLSFRELVHLIEDEACTMPSCWPADGSTFEWLSLESQMDMHTGVWRTTSLHYSQKNPTRNAKYWRLAFKAAGLIKGDKNA